MSMSGFSIHLYIKYEKLKMEKVTPSNTYVKISIDIIMKNRQI